MTSERSPVEEIVETLRRLVEDLEGEFDDDSPEGRLVADVAHAIAEWDRGALGSPP